MTDGMEAHGHGLLVFHFDMDGKFWQKQKLRGLIHENYRQVNMGIMKFFYIVRYSFGWGFRDGLLIVDCVMDSRLKTSGMTLGSVGTNLGFRYGPPIVDCVMDSRLKMSGMTLGSVGTDLGFRYGPPIVDCVVDSRLKMSGMTLVAVGNDFGFSRE